MKEEEKTMKTVSAIEENEPLTPHRLGLLDGQMDVAEDFDTMMSEEIVCTFEGEDEIGEDI